MKGSKGLLTNISNMAANMGKDKTVPVKSNLKSSGKSAPVSTPKAKQKSMPMATKKLGNHWS